MINLVDQKKENNSLSFANGSSQKNGNSDTSVEFKDQRKQALDPSKLQAEAKASRKVKQLATIQQMADNSNTVQLKLNYNIKNGSRVEKKGDNKIWVVVNRIEKYKQRQFRLQNEADREEKITINANSKDWFPLNLVKRETPEPRWLDTIDKLNDEQPSPVSSINASTKGRQKWSNTVTYQFEIQVTEHQREIVRAHVHYTKRKEKGHYKAKGNMWISGLADHSGRTPQWIVDSAPEKLPAEGERGPGW
jgi:hypothetical protein